MPVSDEVAELIAELATRYRPPTIAATLNHRGIPTRSGRGRWTHQAVTEVLDPTWRRDYQRGYRGSGRGGMRR
jgi:hypothetical protein